MTSILNRTTILTAVFISALAFVAAIAAPSAHAAKNTNRYQTSAEAQHKQQCDILWSEFTDAVNNASAAYKANNTAEFNKWMDSARADVQLIADAGCGSASMPTYPPKTPTRDISTSPVLIRTL